MGWPLPRYKQTLNNIKWPIWQPLAQILMLTDLGDGKMEDDTTHKCLMDRSKQREGGWGKLFRIESPCTRRTWSIMHAGKCHVCSKEVGTQRGRRNNVFTLVVKPHLLSGVNVVINSCGTHRTCREITQWVGDLWGRII